MSAKYVDALKGYEYFLSTRGRADRDQVNLALKRQGRNPISARTYSHYLSLLDSGFRTYVPINKFDVFQAIGQLPVSPDRRRFSREVAEVPSSLSFDGESWQPATLVDRSIVGFGGLTRKRIPAKKGDPVWIRLEGYRDIPATLVWKREEPNHTRFGVRALQFMANYSLVAPSVLVTRLMSTIHVADTSQAQLSWSELFRIVRKLNELLAASEELLYAVGGAAGSEVRLAPSLVSSIRVGSPADIQIKADFGIADIIRLIIEKIQFWGLEKRRYRAETEKVELENANLRIEVVRNAINVRRHTRDEALPEGLAEDLIAPSLRALGLEKPPKGLFGPTTLEAGIVRHRLLPAAAELVAGDNPDLAVDVEEATG